MELEQLQKIAIEECQLGKAQKILVGVSGGPDSLCLFDGLARLGFQVVAAHFDHRLRPDSAKDAETVRALAEHWGASFVLGSQDVAGYADAERLSIEAAARVLRYQFLFAQARLFQAQAVAVGHTADDQVETVLMHLLRGSGLDGLKGMAFREILPVWDAAIPLVRPLLAFERVETLAYCAENQLDPVFDPTNQDRTYFRNRLRHELIPTLQTYNAQIKSALWRTAQVLSGDAEIIQDAVDQAWKVCLVESQAFLVTLKLAEVRALSPGIQRRVLRRAVESLMPSASDLDFAAIKRAEQSIQRSVTGSSIDLVHGIRLLLEDERLLVTRQGDLPPDPNWPQWDGLESALLVIPGVLDLGAGWHLEYRWAQPEEVPDFNSPDQLWNAWLDASQLPAGLSVRCQQPGDRFQSLGMEGRSQKLSDFWINAKLPRRARSHWPLIVCGELIAWVPGFRPAHPFRVTAETLRVVHLRLFREVE